MTKQIVSRRTVLKQGVGLPLGGLILASGVSAAAQAADAKVCADPKAMDSGQKSFRTELHYAEKAPDAAMACAGCGFFHGTPDGCGKCDIFQGIVNSLGHCDSWSKKG